LPRSLSIVVPAHNEEKRLRTTLEGVVAAADAVLPQYEVIIVDDGSSDGTRRIADAWAAAHPYSVVIHHPVNRGVGAAYWNALQMARHPFLTLVPGDNAFESACLPAFFSTVGQAEMIISYRANPAARTPVRRLLSIICTALLRIATGLPLRDGHSLYVWPVDKARKVAVPYDYRYHLTSLCALVPEVATYAEIPVRLTPMPDMFSRVLRPKVVLGLGWAMLRILARQSIKRRAHRPFKIEIDDRAATGLHGPADRFVPAK
jgi:glycosyltransferase involved in cell wall biosynthesis